MSFAILYIRLLPGRFTRRLNQLLIFVLVGEAFASNMVVIFHCDPVDRMWNTNKPGRCLDLRLFYYIVVSPTQYRTTASLLRLALVWHQTRHRHLSFHPTSCTYLEASALYGEEGGRDLDALNWAIVSKPVQVDSDIASLISLTVFVSSLSFGLVPLEVLGLM